MTGPTDTGPTDTGEDAGTGADAETGEDAADIRIGALNVAHNDRLHANSSRATAGLSR